MYICINAYMEVHKGIYISFSQWYIYSINYTSLNSGDETITPIFDENLYMVYSIYTHNTLEFHF